MRGRGPRVLRLPGRPQPKGYAEAMLADAGPGSRLIVLSGQIGCDAEGGLPEGLVAQTENALRNIRTILAEAGAQPRHVMRLVWYLVDIEDYLARQRMLGQAYRRVMGRHYPAMSAVAVVRLVEARALVEIEAIALL